MTRLESLPSGFGDRIIEGRLVSQPLPETPDGSLSTFGMALTSRLQHQLPSAKCLVQSCQCKLAALTLSHANALYTSTAAPRDLSVLDGPRSLSELRV